MNFALPGILVSFSILSIHNSDFPVRLSTATLCLSSDYTEYFSVPVCVTILRVLGTVLLADLPGLVPPGEHVAVPLDIVPPSWTLRREGAETREIPGVGLHWLGRKLAPTGALISHQHQ